MIFEQTAILLLLAGMLVAFALDRVRMEVVALGGLTLALFLGLLAPAEAFRGFSNPAFITVVEILLIVQVLGRSGILDPLSRRIPEMARTETGVLAILCTVTAGLSVFMNNIGALALMLPVANSVCRVSGLDPRRILMPLSFAALLGGLCSVIGTPANLIVSTQLATATGHGFAFFDFAWVGVPAALVGILVLLVWPRRVIGPAVGDRTRLPPQVHRDVVSEVEVPTASPLVGVPVSDAGLTIHTMRRGGVHVLHQRPGMTIEPGDVLLLEIGLSRLDALLGAGSLTFPELRAGRAGAQRVEAVIMPASTLVGSRIGTLELLASRGIDVIAVATQTSRIEGSLADLQLSIGDVLYLSGDQAAIHDAVDEADMLPLWPQPQPQPGAGTVRWFAPVVFACGVLLSAVGLVQPELAFGLVLVVLTASGSLSIRKGLAELDWQILIMLATMIPLGTAVETTGAAAVLAGGLTAALPSHGAMALAAAMLILAVVITPFVNNASTALILGPIALGVSATSGMPPEPLLIAVALGASIDFLTPIGHHNNTIVMGIAGYRFSDFMKAGWPVTMAVVAVAMLATWAVWN